MSQIVQSAATVINIISFRCRMQLFLISNRCLGTSTNSDIISPVNPSQRAVRTDPSC